MGPFKIFVEVLHESERIKPSQQALRDVLRKHKKIGTRLHRIITKWFYDCMRKLGLIDEIAANIAGVEHVNILDPWLRAGLRAAVYFAVFQKASKRKLEILRGAVAKVLSENTHPYTGMFFYKKMNELIENRTILREKIKKDRRYKYLLQDWFIDYFEKILGKEEARKLFKAMLREPKISIRVNTLKIRPEEMKEILEKKYNKRVEFGMYLKEILKFEGPFNFDKCKEFKNGYFVIQEEAAAVASIILDPKPGMEIVDMCAAPGGKTEHIAELMKNEGIIYAFDIDELRIKRMRETLERCGIKIVKIYKEDARKASEVIGKGFADKVLLDAPCTSDGTIAKNPELRWRLRWKKVEEMAEIQWELLNEAKNLVKPGGEVLYCTCSMFLEENEKLIEKFLKKNKNFEIVKIEGYYSLGFLKGTRRAWPHKHNTIGFFYAKLRRKF